MLLAEDEPVRPRIIIEAKNIERSLAGSDWQKESKSMKLTSPLFNST
jgi:hypothetical protein